MFRRRWSGLPADPIFASDLKELGYFINDIDEIRSIEDPDYYFKYFLTKNERWNERQRFAFNEAVRKEIHKRLDAHNFTTIPLPLGTPPTQPHVPIRTTPNLAGASRVVVFFHESSQSLGVLAHRVIGGRGGVARGSAVGLADAVMGKTSPPGFVLANAGELWWWPEGARGLTPVQRHRVPMASAVHLGRYHDPKVNEVPGHRTVAEHVRAVFEALMDGGLVNGDAKLDVIAVGDTADEVERYLNDDKVWGKIGGRMGCLAILGGYYSSKEFKCEGFKRFMRERGRAYMIHHTPLDNPIAGPNGNPGAAGFTSFGCPVFSAGKAQVTETIPVEAQSAVLKWMQQVAMEGEAYKNDIIDIFGEDGGGIVTEGNSSWWGAPQADSNNDGEAEGQAKNTKVADGKDDGTGGESHTENGKVNQTTQVKKDAAPAKGTSNKATGPSTSTDSKVVPAKENDVAGVGGVNIHSDDKTPFPPTSEGPNAEDMKELVTEMKDLTATH
ncbi:Arb2 domain-containing protein [Chaetomium fimeti]|uniref:Arb2 domain-containing protein n=1 Tax=Chaetomium fimeti TaxID=1854472 RepID=A0AAE0HLT5_9PEZI|nr:Arb2 domain-containing protein [Chaetomium fimeti]